MAVVDAGTDPQIVQVYDGLMARPANDDFKFVAVNRPVKSGVFLLAIQHPNQPSMDGINRGLLRLGGLLMHEKMNICRRQLLLPEHHLSGCFD